MISKMDHLTCFGQILCFHSQLHNLQYLMYCTMGVHLRLLFCVYFCIHMRAPLSLYRIGTRNS